MTHYESNEPVYDEIPAGSERAVRLAMRWSLAVVLVVAGATGLAAIWWLRPMPAPIDRQTSLSLPRPRAVEKARMPDVRFVDVTRQAGITFVHENGATGEKLLPETMGGGCAFVDFDGDGDQDVILVNSSRWPWDTRTDEAPEAVTEFYENDGTGNFANVTGRVTDGVQCYGMGIATGDYDNDGDADLFLSAVGTNRLLRNDAGHFVDVAESAGVAGASDEWSTSSAFVDYDNDGDLDLFVCNYIRWSQQIDIQQDFSLTGIGRAYGPPTSFGGAFPYLYRNNGDGRFTDVSSISGIQVSNLVTGVPLAKSLGVVPIDIDSDGWIDFVVANDTVRNFVFHNQQDGSFVEEGVELGVAFDSSGNARGAMGIDAAHFREDGTLGIAVANFSNEMTALYVMSPAELLFNDDAVVTGLGPPTRLELSFGLFFFDYDLDGRLDLLAANGHLEADINRVQESQQYQQPARLFWNAGALGPSEFLSVPSEKCGADLHQPIVGRGAAYADIDGDGDLDVLLTQIAGPPLLLRNDQQLNRHYLRLRLTGTASNRDAIGSRVTVDVGSHQITRQVMPTRSYLSQVELPVTIGIGDRDRVERITVKWTDGSTQEVTDFRIDELTEIVQTSGTSSGSDR